MFHVCCKGVLEECFKAFFVLISRVLQGCIEIVLRMLPGGFKVFFLYFKGISCSEGVSRGLQ